MKNKPLQKDLFFSKTGEYLNHYLPNQVHKSPKTIKTYRDALTVFRRYLLEERGISALKTAHMNYYWTIWLTFQNQVINLRPAIIEWPQ